MLGLNPGPSDSQSDALPVEPNVQFHKSKLQKSDTFCSSLEKWLYLNG